MSSIVLGRKINIEMFITDGYYRLLCGKTMEYTADMDMIETTSVNSPNAREFMAGLMNSFLNISGVTTINAVNNKVSPIYLLQESVRRVKQLFRITFEDQDGATVSISFSGLIKTINITRDILQWSQSSVAIQVSGGIEITDPIPSPVVVEKDALSDWWEVVNGQDYVDVGGIDSAEWAYRLAADDEILEIGRSGDVYDIVTGTPGNRQARFNTSNLHIEFDPTNPLNTGETVYVLFERPL